MSLAFPTSSKSNTTLTNSNSFSDNHEDLVSQVIFLLQYIKQILQYKIKFYNIINLQLCSINSKYIFQINYQEEDNQSLDNILVLSRSPKLKQQTVLQLFEKSASYDGNMFEFFIVNINFIFELIH